MEGVSGREMPTRVALVLTPRAKNWAILVLAAGPAAASGQVGDVCRVCVGAVGASGPGAVEPDSFRRSHGAAQGFGPWAGTWWREDKRRAVWI
jgi:hypothetical protein